MKIFISWSGETSRAVAEALRDWLPSVIQVVKPFLSAKDIDKGARWTSEIERQLGDSSAGIICLTSENLHSEWIHFEAGALSKTVGKTLVCPYLLGLERTDVGWPLAQFQVAKAEKDDTRKLLHTINKALGDGALAEIRLDKVFDKWWPEFEEKLRAAADAKERGPEIRSDRQIFEETLELVRQIARVRLLSRPTIPEATTMIRRLMHEGLDWGDIVRHMAHLGVPSLWCSETLAEIAKAELTGSKRPRHRKRA